MADKNTTDKYVDYINKHILQSIDYSELQKSYGTDMSYAKTVLNKLHDAMVKVYGSEQFDEYDGDDGVVIIPGIIRGRESGKMCVVLLDIDLYSSGEHWGTTFLCEYGVINQNQVYSKTADSAELRKAIAPYSVYDYCYTAEIPDDIHIDKTRMPEDIKSVLRNFRNHAGEKPSVIKQIRETEKVPEEPKRDKQTSKKNEPEH